MRPSKVNVSAAARRLRRPFEPVNLATVNDMAVNLIRCEGTFPWHKHEQMDEIFYVHTGSMLLETEVGSAMLQAGELIFAPANVAHSPSSVQPAEVLFFLKYMAFPRNGDRYTLPRHDRLPDKINIGQRARLLKPLVVDDLAAFDDFAVRLMVCEGSQAWHAHAGDDEMALVAEGHLRLEHPDGVLDLRAGELSVMPRDGRHRLSSDSPASVLLLTRLSAQTPQ